MKLAPRSIRFFALAACLALSGCAPSPPTGKTAQPTPSATAAPQQQAGPDPKAGDVPAAQAETITGSCPDARTIAESARSRADCYQLRPRTTRSAAKGRQATVKGTKTTAKKGQKKGAGAKKTQAAMKKSKQPAGRSTAAVRAPQSGGGLCQPQSLIYARCRTGISTCRLGDTSPVQWFACAKGMKNTTAIPVAGSVLVLDVNCRRGMPTGHPVYVEEARPNGNGTWTLRISHTNYDRQCHLDQDATVLFHPAGMIADFRTGPWASWANDLKALGFILR